MKIRIVAVGKTDGGFIGQGVDEYLKRLRRYVRVEVQIIPELKASKNLTPEQIMAKEEQQILSAVGSGEFYLLDEKGKEYTSVELANFLEAKMVLGIKGLVFVVGGAYGVTSAVKQKAAGMIALSKLTFSHQMVRMFFLEQLYRGMTIIRGEPYHHE